MTHADGVPAVPPLPAPARSLLDTILGGESLGASRNIRQINDLFVQIVEASTEESPAACINTLHATGDYLIATRGRNTPAIGNAIRLMLNGLDQLDVGTVEELQTHVAERRAEFNTRSLQNKERLAEYGANLLADCKTILPFDYSSTMMAILEALADRGQRLHLIVPESRSLDGGRPIVNEATAMGHAVTFVIDMSFHHFISDVDAVIIGAETIFATGDTWNTVGSYPIAVLADLFQVPFYVATELIKIAPRSFLGMQRAMKPYDYAEILDHPASLRDPDAVSVMAAELDTVPASLITSYVTPQGILLPQHIRSEALVFLSSIGATPFTEK